jgi:phage terminase large subunit-like protein
MTTSGLMIATFTPLLGLSNVVLGYLPEMAPSVTG